MWRTASITLPVPASPFRPDHGGPFPEPPQGLAQVRGAADEGDFEVPLVDVIFLVGRREDLALVDVVDAEGFQDLGLDEVADPALGHHGDRDGLHDGLDDGGVRHAGNTAFGPDVGGDAFQGHDGHGAGFLGDLGLVRRRHVHDDAALEHLGQTGFYS